MVLKYLTLRFRFYEVKNPFIRNRFFYQSIHVSATNDPFRYKQVPLNQLYQKFRPTDNFGISFSSKFVKFARS